MATRGRKPKPTALKKLHGSATSRINEHEPKVEPSAIEPPEFLNDEARAEWARVCPLLFKARVITELDRAIFASYCEAWATYVQACRDVAKYGTVLISKKPCPTCKGTCQTAGGEACSRCEGKGFITGQAYQGPWVNVRSMADKQMRACAVELGLTPSSRTRIHVAPDDQDVTGKARFFTAGLKVIG